jgi:hypothetical protein
MATRLAFEVPRHIASTPAGDQILHRVFYLSERDLQRLIVRALRVVSAENAVRLARDRLVSIFDDLAQTDAAARKKAASALALLANSGDEHAAAVVQALPALVSAPALRAEIVAGLHPSALTSPLVTFASLIRDPDRDVRRAIFTQIGELASDEDVLDLLASQLRGGDVQLRETLLRALDVDRKSDELRVFAPAKGNRWRLLEELVEAPEAGRVLSLEDALRDVDLPGRHRILRALGRRAVADAAAQDVLLRAVKGPSGVAALRALEHAAALPKPPASIVRALLDAAQSQDLLLREEALRMLASVQVPVDPELLSASLGHPSAPIRIQAALALWRRGNKAGEAMLLKAMTDPELGGEARAAIRN